MPNLDISTKRNSCAKIMAVALLTIALSVTAAMAQTNVYTNPVGFYSLPAGTGTANQFNLVGLPMQPMRMDQGLVTAVTSNVLSTVCGTCSTNNYGTLNGQSYYVELETGNGIGQYFGIVSNDTLVNIVVSDSGENLTTINGGVAANDAYRIYPFWRLRDIFGPASACSLTAGTKVSNSDNVFVWNGSTFLQFFPSSSLGVWDQNGVGANDNFAILPDEALYILRKSATPTNTLLVGEVRVTNTVSVLTGGGVFTMLCNSYPAGTTLDASGLTAAGTGFHGGTKVSNADNVFLWDPVNQVWQQYFYSTSLNSWDLNGVGATNGVPLPAAGGMWVLCKTTGGLWNKALPYSP